MRLNEAIPFGHIIKGDSRSAAQILYRLPRISCVVTSPPYFQLRDNGFEEQIGGPDSTIHEYIDDLGEVFEGISRRLLPHANVWINIGEHWKDGRIFDVVGMLIRRLENQCNLELIQKNIWHKPNSKPESMKNRTSKKFEYVLHFRVAGGKQYFDDKAVREDTGAKLGNVWKISHAVSQSSHSSSFPEELPDRCIRLGCPPLICSNCSAPWINYYTQEEPDPCLVQYCGGDRSAEYHGTAKKDYKSQKAENARDLKKRVLKSLGKWIPGYSLPYCSCNLPPVSPTVLDPFMGTGTTGIACKNLGRQFIGIEGNQEFFDISRERLR